MNTKRSSILGSAGKRASVIQVPSSAGLCARGLSSSAITPAGSDAGSTLFRYSLLLLAATLFMGHAEQAMGSIKLITLPPRERVELQLDHPGVTLVEEERFVPLTAGVNEVVFGWVNAQIDKSSIQFHCMTDPDHIKVLSVSYPPGQNSLIWNVAAPTAVSARVRISYIIGGLNKSFAYRAVAAHDEQTLMLRQYIQLHNHANEEFGSAGMWAGFGERLERPIGINETKKLLSAKFTKVPIRKTYTADMGVYGYSDPTKKQLRIPMHYVLINDEANGLGRFPLPSGKMRIFQDDGQGSVAFLGEDWGGFTPRDDELKLFLGEAKDVVVKRTIARREQVRTFGNLHDYHVVVQYEIENFKDQAVGLDLIESPTALRRELFGDIPRNVQWEVGDEGTLSELRNTEKSTAEKVVFNVPLPARGADQKAVKLVHTFHVVIKNEW